MTWFFYNIEDYIPAFALWVLWLLACPVRLLALALLPQGARRAHHHLFHVREFFAFEGV